MTIYNSDLTKILESPDLTKGYLEPAEKTTHHKAVKEKSHYEVMDGTVTADCPNGLRRLVIDQHARAAYDTTEAVQKYIEYTAEELAAQQAEKDAAEKAQAEAEAAAKAQQEEAEKAAAEAAEKAAEREELLDRLDAQVTYTALMTDTVLMAEEETDNG